MFLSDNNSCIFPLINSIKNCKIISSFTKFSLGDAQCFLKNIEFMKIN